MRFFFAYADLSNGIRIYTTIEGLITRIQVQAAIYRTEEDAIKHLNDHMATLDIVQGWKIDSVIIG